MDVSQLIQQKLIELKLGQRDLANAAEVTEAYISQLLSRKKLPPAPARTDIYDKLGRILKLPPGKLAGLADVQRRQELKKKIQSPPAPLFRHLRDLLLHKCSRDRRAQIRAVFEKEPFGEVERLITQKLLNIVKELTSEELGRKDWLRVISQESGRGYKQMRIAALEFLETDIFNITPENCIAFLDPVIVSWDIDLGAFELEIVLNSRIASTRVKRFAFVEKVTGRSDEEPGFAEFLKNRSLSGAATAEEVEFLKGLRFKDGRRPTSLYYYREIQNLRDPLHFRRK